MRNLICFPDLKLPKLLAFVLGAVTIFVFYKLVVVDRMGFCYKRLNFVSSNELILNQIEGLIRAGRIKVDESDTSPQAYLKHHPNCCRVNWGNDGAFGRGLIYFGSAEVTVIYEMNRDEMSQTDNELNKVIFYEYLANVTACGETVGYTGMAIATPPHFKPTINK